MSRVSSVSATEATIADYHCRMEFRDPDRDRRAFLAPRLGELTLREAGSCLGGLRTLAEQLAAHDGDASDVSACVRAATWLDRQLAALDPDQLMLGTYDAGGVLLDPVPGGLTGVAGDLDKLATFFPANLEASEHLCDHCWTFAVAADDPANPSDALLELGRRALSQEHAAGYVVECFDQLRNAPAPSVRLMALYYGVDGYLKLGEQDEVARPEAWQLAADNLRTLLREQPNDLRHQLHVTPADLRADLANLEHGRQPDRRHSALDRPTFTGLN